MSIITQRGNLAEIVTAKLNERIESGLYAAGEKIPSSAMLCEEFGVSRTVIREALTSLKFAGRVTARQGAGVFVTEKETRPLNYEISRTEDIRSAMQILELRLGVELQSVALAAARRTPEALAEIARAMTISKPCKPTMRKSRRAPISSFILQSRAQPAIRISRASSKPSWTASISTYS